MSTGVERVSALIRQQVGRNSVEWGSGARSGGRFPPFRSAASSAVRNLDYRRQDWRLQELMRFYDRQFVQAAYLVLLKRDCDAEGMSDRLGKLRSGDLSRLGLLFRLRYGPEGKEHATRIRGLLVAFAVDSLCRVPVLGLVPRTIQGLIHLPGLQRDLEELRALLAQHENDAHDPDGVPMDLRKTKSRDSHTRPR